MATFQIGKLKTCLHTGARASYCPDLGFRTQGSWSDLGPTLGPLLPPRTALWAPKAATTTPGRAEESGRRGVAPVSGSWVPTLPR